MKFCFVVHSITFNYIKHDHMKQNSIDATEKNYLTRHHNLYINMGAGIAVTANQQPLH